MPGLNPSPYAWKCMAAAKSYPRGPDELFTHIVQRMIKFVHSPDKKKTNPIFP